MYGHPLVVEVDGLDHVFCGTNNAMKAVSQTNGTLQWSVTTGSINGGVAYLGGNVFFGAQDKIFRALVASTGAQVWQMTAGN